MQTRELSHFSSTATVLTVLGEKRHSRRDVKVKMRLQQGKEPLRVGGSCLVYLFGDLRQPSLMKQQNGEGFLKPLSAPTWYGPCAETRNDHRGL